MSLRELARAHLETMEALRRQGSPRSCPVSGHIGMSGPDKTAQPHISRRGAPVRTPDAIRTGFPSDTPDNPDASDNSDKPDITPAMTAPRRSMSFPVPRPKVTGPTDRFCSCGRMATLAYPRGDGRDVWHCLECLEADGRA